MVKFPMKFKVKTSAKGGIGTQWTAQANGLPPIPSAIPPEFSGPGGGYSPEDLFGVAVINCLTALYKVYCERAKITFQHFEAEATVIIDKQPSDPSFVVTEVNIYATISGASDTVKAKELFDQAAKDCPIGNSIRSGKTFHVNIT